MVCVTVLGWARRPWVGTIAEHGVSQGQPCPVAVGAVELDERGRAHTARRAVRRAAAVHAGITPSPVTTAGVPAAASTASRMVDKAEGEEEDGQAYGTPTRALVRTPAGG